ncbi:MAG TPA: LysM peptidoglycan-binding domain-containing protein [Phycisphaerae bacterium]|nr:LysM peptidoglycan-binding domain-containing protein [Phycisphaerae bacterium]
MGTETRIGIVTGLLIVVVASVYFFYGSNSEKDDFLVATGSKVGESGKTGQPLKIPIGDDKNKAAGPSAVSKAPAKAPAVPGKSVNPTDKGPAIAGRPAPGVGQPSALPVGPRPASPPAGPPNTGSATVANRVPAGPVIGPPAIGGDRRRPETSGTSVALAEPRGSERGTAIPAAGKPAAAPEKAAESSDAGPSRTTALRTGAAKELLDATRENIEKAVQLATTSTSTGGASADGARRTAAGSSGSPSDESQPSRPESRISSTERKEAEDSKETKAATPATESRVAAAPSANTPSGWPKQHKIASGETIATLAQHYYGDSSGVSEILAANPQVNPRRLKVGDTIVIPAPKGKASAAAKSESKQPETGEKAKNARPAEVAKTGSAVKLTAASSSKTYQVREGDTLFSIAKAVCGNGARWSEIYELNKTTLKNDPQHLKPGMVLKLPES